MSKFDKHRQEISKQKTKNKNIKIKGEGNQVGSNNNQNSNNKTVHHHHYHNSNSNSTNGQGEQILAFGLIVVGFLAGLMWLYFNHLDQIHLYLKFMITTSPILGLLGTVFLYFDDNIEVSDLLHTCVSFFIGILLIFLTTMGRDYVPSHFIYFAQQLSAVDFFKELNARHEINIGAASLLSTLFIGASTFFAHCLSFRQFSYALANEKECGFWYVLYKKNIIGSLNFVGITVLFLLLMAFSLLKGYLL